MELQITLNSTWPAFFAIAHGRRNDGVFARLLHQQLGIDRIQLSAELVDVADDADISPIFLPIKLDV